MFQFINKYRPWFLIVSSFFATAVAGLSAITFLLPKNIQHSNIEFIKFFLITARYEMASVIIALVTVLVLIYLAKQSLRQLRQYFIASAKHNSAKISVLLLIILLLLIIGFTCNPIIREGYFIARSRYYFWSELFYTSYMHSLIVSAHDKENQGNYIEALRIYDIAQDQTINNYIKTNLNNKIKSLNGRLKYFQLLHETYKNIIKKNGFTKEAFFYLSEAYRVDSHNVFVKTELESRLRKISDEITAKTATKFYNACLSNNKPEYTKIFQASSWYLFDKEVIAELQKGYFGRPIENPSEEACQITLNYSTEDFLAIIASGWQLNKILSSITNVDYKLLSRSHNEINNIKSSYHSLAISNISKSNNSYVTRDYSRLNNPIGPKEIDLFSHIRRDLSKSSAINDRAPISDFSANGFNIQLISLSGSRVQVAERIKNEVIALGFPSYTTMVYSNNNIFIRVMSGPFSSRARAEEVNSAIKAGLNLKNGIIHAPKP